jgi:hypothetical protein
MAGLGAVQVLGSGPDQSIDQGLSHVWAQHTPPPSVALARTVGWHIANLEFANAAPLHAVSLLQWDQARGPRLQPLPLGGALTAQRHVSVCVHARVCVCARGNVG